jgi:2-keto-4-pentenoate hydratase
MTPAAIGKAVAILETLRADATFRLDHFPADCRPLTEEDGYTINAALHERFVMIGYGKVVGYKLGCTTAVMQERLGCDHPTAGCVLDTRVFRREAAFAFDACRYPGCENEIVVRLGRDLPAGGAPYDRRSVERAVDTVMAGIELVETRYVLCEEKGPRRAHLPTVIADDFWQSALIVGDPIAHWRSVDLAANVARTRMNDAEVGCGLGRDALGHPIDAVTWLANHLALRGSGLRAGELISTGSLVTPVRPTPGDVVVCDHGQLGRVTVRMR